MGADTGKKAKKSLWLINTHPGRPDTIANRHILKPNLVSIGVHQPNCQRTNGNRRQKRTSGEQLPCTADYLSKPNRPVNTRNNEFFPGDVPKAEGSELLPIRRHGGLCLQGLRAEIYLKNSSASSRKSASRVRISPTASASGTLMIFVPSNATILP